LLLTSARFATSVGETSAVLDAPEARIGFCPSYRGGRYAARACVELGGGALLASTSLPTKRAQAFGDAGGELAVALWLSGPVWLEACGAIRTPFPRYDFMLNGNVVFRESPALGEAGLRGLVTFP
jgi:hypothetical protein